MTGKERDMLWKVRKVVVDGWVVLEREISVWTDSRFVVRFPGGEVTFRVLKVYEDEAHCEVLEGEEILRKVRAA